MTKCEVPLLGCARLISLPRTVYQGVHTDRCQTLRQVFVVAVGGRVVDVPEAWASFAPAKAALKPYIDARALRCDVSFLRNYP